MPSKNAKDKDLNKDFEESKLKDLKDPNVPPCLYWTIDDVCNFFEKDLKLPEYKQTLQSNKIDGRRLIFLDTKHLPKLGIQDFKHTLLITEKVREILNMNSPYWNRSISLTPRESNELYLEKKSFIGIKSDNLTSKDFHTKTADAKWAPPLTNQGFIQPSF